MEHLWAPWRNAYVTGTSPEKNEKLFFNIVQRRRRGQRVLLEGLDRFRLAHRAQAKMPRILSSSAPNPSSLF